VDRESGGSNIKLD